jgi:hypothetical protein
VGGLAGQHSTGEMVPSVWTEASCAEETPQVAVAEQQIIRARSSDIRDVFTRWVTREWSTGTRFVILEGLMGSGKSMLTKQPFALDTQQSTNIEVDEFLRAPVDPDLEYMEAIDIGAANKAIQEAIQVSPLVIAEGPMVWPVVQRALKEIPTHALRRVYLKRMSSRNPDEWEDFEFLQESERPTAYGRSIDRYHVTERPWLLADVILERTGRDED